MTWLPFVSKTAVSYLGNSVTNQTGSQMIERARLHTEVDGENREMYSTSYTCRDKHDVATLLLSTHPERIRAGRNKRFDTKLRFGIRTSGRNELGRMADDLQLRLQEQSPGLLRTTTVSKL